MSSISESANSWGLSLKNPWAPIIRYAKKFFVSKEITKAARAYHGSFSYSLVPNTAIRDFNSISKVTRLVSGDCYLYLFPEAAYVGPCRIVCPGEVIQPESCGSLIASTQTLSVDGVTASGHPPEWCWEMPGAMYLMHFSSAYRYV